MKNLFIIAILFLLAVACEQKEVLPPQSDPVSQTPLTKSANTCSEADQTFVVQTEQDYLDVINLVDSDDVLVLEAGVACLYIDLAPFWWDNPNNGTQAK